MKETWNPAEISEDIKPGNYVRSDSWNAAELNEAINLFGIKYPIDTWNPAELDEKARNIINDITSIKTITGNPISFKTINGGYAKSCEVTFSPIQSGSGEPSPENVRPISGWDSLVLKQLDKNKFTDDGDYKKWYSSNGDISDDYGGYITPFIDNNYSSVRIMADYSSNMNTCSVVLFDSSKNFIERKQTPITSDSFPIDFTEISNNVKYIRFQISMKNAVLANPITKTIVDGWNISLNGCITHTATFSDTVYGGEYEFVSGKAKSEWGYIASYNGETITEPWISDRDVYVAGTTPSTGAEVCYKLATPQEITLTPETIALLKGNNVLFTDGDSIELKYTKLALPDDSDGLSLNQKVKKAIEIIKEKVINEELKKEETKKSTTKGRRKKS